MKKMFLAGPFKALVDGETQEMSQKDVSFFTSIIEFFEARGWDVHCAHRREKWGREFMTPAECTTIDHREISACDVLLASPGSPASPGTHIELGWASALRKPIVLLMEQGKEYAFLVKGLEELTEVQYVSFGASGPINEEIEQAIRALVPATQ